MQYLVLFALCACTGQLTTGHIPIGKSTWSRDPVIRYAAENSLRLHAAQLQIIQETGRLFGTGMLGAPEVVQLNQNLMRAIGAKNVLDVGLFTGYSALGAALAIPDDGLVIGMDIFDQYWNRVGLAAFDLANVTHKIRPLFYPARDIMNELIANGTSGQWDFCFIDADKVNYSTYYEQCLTLLRPGGIITVDNTLWSGLVAGSEASMDESTLAIHHLNQLVKNDTRVHCNLLTIADGLTVALKI